MTPTATLPAVPEQQEIETKITTLSEKTMQLRVIDDNSLLIADSIQTECRKMRQYIEEKYKKIKKPISESLENVRNMEKADLAKVVPLEEHVKAERIRYQFEQKKKREAEEARLRKEAEEREEAERLERAAEIEREAAKLRESGQVEEAAAVQQEAEQVMDTPTYVPPPRMAPTPKTKNAMKMIVDHGQLETIINSLNSNLRSTPPNIPGVRFFQVWQFEVFNATAVPESYRKPS